MISTSTKNSINAKISLEECTGLNLEGTETVKEALGFGGCIKSLKGDPELIIFIKFKDNVNLSGIMVESSMDDTKRPSIMHLFINKNDLGFSDIGSINSTESVDLQKNLGKIVNLKIAKFRSVSSLAVRLINSTSIFPPIIILNI